MEKLDIQIQTKWTLTPYLTYHIKTKISKWIIDLNVQPKTLKFLGERIGENLCDVRLGKDFLPRTQKA